MKNYTAAMPANESAEKSVLSTMMHHPNLHKQAMADGIDLECFWFPTNQIIFEAIKDTERDSNGETKSIRCFIRCRQVQILHGCITKRD